VASPVASPLILVDRARPTDLERPADLAETVAS
jgi:hypothetical protein